MWPAQVAIVVLMLLAAGSSFWGAERAGEFFNSVPMAVFWIFLALLLAAGLISFRSMIRNPSVAAMHLGCLLVILGGLWGSQAAHELRGGEKIFRGYMPISQRQANREVMDERLKNVVGQLDFEVFLEKFRIEYYPSRDWRWDLYGGVKMQNSGQIQAARIDWKKDQWTTLPFCDEISFRVLEYACRKEGVSNGESLPELKLELKRGDTTVIGRFMAREGASYEELRLVLLYDNNKQEWQKAGSPTLFLDRPDAQVKDYKTWLVIHRDSREVARKVIEVNDPLHYGGYHFYQVDCDENDPTYTILLVKSDDGLAAVYIGFILLGVGAFGRFWIRPILSSRKRGGD